MNRPTKMAAMGAGALLIVALGVFVFCSSLRADSPPDAADDGAKGALVLQTGGVLVGRISRDGERYLVEGSNSQLRVPASDVAFACRSLDEAYELKRGQISKSAPTAGAHLELAEWCLRYKLTSQAEKELAAARTLDPQHPRLSLVERRLAVAIRPPSKGTHARVDAEPAAAKPAEELSRLSTMARKLPDEVVERFTRKVQPVLVNNCTTAGCHQRGGEQEFQLDRAILYGMANRRSTLRNLEATLALVDHATPQLSLLLTIPRNAHGGLEKPLLGAREEQQFEQLVEWVVLVTASETPPASALAKEQRSEAAAGNPAPIVVPASHETDLMPVVTEPRVQFGATPKPRGPRDPFDPEIFNNQAE